MPKDSQYSDYIGRLLGMCLEVDSKVVITRKAKYNTRLGQTHDVSAATRDSGLTVLSRVVGIS